MPACSTKSCVARKPAVSIKCTGKPAKLIVALMRSRVVPATGVTIASSSPASRLSKALFPTLGAPTKTNCIPSRKITPCVAACCNSAKRKLILCKRWCACALSKKSISSSGKSRVASTKMRKAVISSTRALIVWEKAPCNERVAARTAASLCAPIKSATASACAKSILPLR